MTYHIPTPLILGKFHSWGDFQYHNSITRNNSIIRRQQPSLPNPHKHITVLVLPPLLLVIINIYITYNTTWTIFLSLSSGRLITNLVKFVLFYCIVYLFQIRFIQKTRIHYQDHNSICFLFDWSETWGTINKPTIDPDGHTFSTQNCLFYQTFSNMAFKLIAITKSFTNMYQQFDLIFPIHYTILRTCRNILSTK